MSAKVHYLTDEISRVCHCCHPGCGVPIYMPTGIEQMRRRDHATFYCFNGHSQHFTVESDVERERRLRQIAERDAEREQHFRTLAENSARAYKGHLTRVKRRISNGVCPCCKRMFQNLADHMADKHPGYTEPEP